MENISLLFLHCPSLNVPGMSTEDRFGDFYVIIDERLSNAEKLEAYQHELRHIKKKHLMNDISIEQAEKEASDLF
jgi:hypothetical protein